MNGSSNMPNAFKGQQVAFVDSDEAMPEHAGLLFSLTPAGRARSPAAPHRSTFCRHRSPEQNSAPGFSHRRITPHGGHRRLATDIAKQNIDRSPEANAVE
jgi:hypothetical protein